MSTIFDIPIQTISRDHPLYPAPLLDLVDPPDEIHVRGKLPLHFDNALSVVGSRKISSYGLHVVRNFVPSLVRKKMIIISGFMYGVDTAAHKAAISSGGVTCAVLGNGLNHIYPLENEHLYYEILRSGGCVISEYPHDFKPQNWTFPKRNRIVAALSLKGTLVIEAAERSGSLITASYSDALNRPLFAVPGPLNSLTSKGTNQLIKDKIANMVTTPEDIVFSH